MAYQRQMGEAVNIKAALPDVERRQMYNYDEAIRRRLNPIAAIGQDANARSAMRTQEAQQQAYKQRLAAIQSASGAVPVGNGQWYHPLGNSMAPTFGFGAKYSKPVAGNVYHQGADFAVEAGTPVYAPGYGTLASYGAETGGFGNALRLALNGGYTGILGHLSSFAPNLKANMPITPGMLLGYTGNSGYSTGDHLHYELRDRLNRAINLNQFYGW